MENWIVVRFGDKPNQIWIMNHRNNSVSFDLTPLKCLLCKSLFCFSLSLCLSLSTSLKFQSAEQACEWVSVRTRVLRTLCIFCVSVCVPACICIHVSLCDKRGLVHCTFGYYILLRWHENFRHHQKNHHHLPNTFGVLSLDVVLRILLFQVNQIISNETNRSSKRLNALFIVWPFSHWTPFESYSFSFSFSFSYSSPCSTLLHFSNCILSLLHSLSPSLRLLRCCHYYFLSYCCCW